MAGFVFRIILTGIGLFVCKVGLHNVIPTGGEATNLNRGHQIWPSRSGGICAATDLPLAGRLYGRKCAHADPSALLRDELLLKAGLQPAAPVGVTGIGLLVC